MAFDINGVRHDITIQIQRPCERYGFRVGRMCGY